MHLPARAALATTATLSLVATGALSALTPTTAFAAPASTPAAVSITATGAFSGTVPAGVCAVRAEVLGAAGGHNVISGGVSVANANGGGADITATYSVVPGMAFSGVVGGGGAQAQDVGKPGDGGQNGGGRGGVVANGTHPGSGGGGHTDLSLGGTEVIVAGGGGGSGGGHSTTKGFGGDAGLPTQPGAVAAGSDGGSNVDSASAVVNGGGGGTAASGAGGTNSKDASLNGAAGSGRTGGNGGADPTPDSGGGGGGGYYGGGGGASTNGNDSGAPRANGWGGAGGGGGSSWVRATSPDGTGAPVSSLSSVVGGKRATGGPGADGSVTLTWIPCDYDLRVTKSVSSTEATPGTTVTWTVTVTNLGDDPMTKGDTVTLADSLPGSGTKTITGISTSGGSNSQHLARGAVTCDATVGGVMPATLTCSRPYSAPDAPDAPSGGNRGLDKGETLTVAYTQVVSGSIGSKLANKAEVTDRKSGDSNDTDTATLTIVAPQPVASADATSGPQGKPQSIDPLLNDDEGDAGSPLLPSTLTLLSGAGDPVTSVTIPNQGTYTVSSDHKLVFTPLPAFVGEATPVDYRIADTNGTTAESTYTPTVTPVTAPDTTSGPQGVPQSIDPLANDTLDPSVTLVPTTLTLIDPGTGSPAATVTIPGQGTYSIADGKLVFTPLPTFTGTATPVTYQADDNAGHHLQNRYTPAVSPVTPTALPDTTSGPQGVPQSIDPLGNDKPGTPLVPLDASTLTLLNSSGSPVSSVTIPNQGTYTVSTDHKLVFTPLPGFVGTATPVDYRIADANGTAAKSTYTPTLTAVAPVAHPDTTSGPQGAAQSIDPVPNDKPGDLSVPLDASTLTLLNSSGSPVSSVTIPNQGTYTVSSDHKLVFTPLPAFVGEATPVDYRIADANGTPTTSTYTPTVTPVTAPDATSGPQGLAQTIDPLLNDDADSSVMLEPSSLRLVDPGTGGQVTSVTIAGQGTYTVSTDHKLVFTPLPGFVGTATAVAYQVRDTHGNLLQNTYTPTLTPVTPTALPDTTSGPQGVPQSIDPLGNDKPGTPLVPLGASTLTLLNSSGSPVSSVTIPNQGTYTVSSDHKLVFTPLPAFVGEATPVDYRIADANGTTARSTYTPTVVAATPIASPDTTSGPQGAPQSIDPLGNDSAGDPGLALDPDSLTLLDAGGHPVASVTVPGQGTYTVAGGKLVFTPLPAFVGEATPVTYRVANTNGTTTTSTYTPTLTPVTAPDTTSGPQGVPQSVDPVANDVLDPAVSLVPATLALVHPGTGAIVSSATIPGQGTYTVAGGRIVFTPLPAFVGTADPVTYQVDDAAGNHLRNTHTPTVGPVAPVATPDTTSGPQGVPQSIDPLGNDGPGDPLVPLSASTLTLLDASGDPASAITIPNQGTYTIAAGKLVFTPLPTFAGAATPVDYRIADVNGTAATATYTPTVTPVAPVASPDTSTGELNTPQSVDPFANDSAGDPAVPLDRDSLTLLDADGNPATSVTIDRQGTYTISGHRIVFTPVKAYTGTATPVAYRIADANGTTTESTYTPTVVAGPPVVLDLPKTALRGSTVVLNPVASTPGLVPSSIYLLDPDGNQTRSLVVDGEGTWTVDPAAGTVTFVPASGFSGDPTPVEYVGLKSDGTPVTGVLSISYHDPELAYTGFEGAPWLLGAGVLLVALGGVLVRRRGIGWHRS